MITHDGNGTISSVVANVVIGSHTSASGPVAIEQTFKLKYRSSKSITRESAKNNLVDSDRSGNPGYQQGLPIRMGKIEEATGLSAVSELEEGLQLIGTGACSVDLRAMSQVKFGEDIQTSCSLSMTESEFATYCIENAIPPELGLLATHVATFGSSDPLTVGEWLELAITVPSESAATYSPTTGKCTDIVRSIF